MNKHIKELKERITEHEDIDIIAINKIMKESVEKHLKVKTKIRKEKLKKDKSV